MWKQKLGINYIHFPDTSGADYLKMIKAAGFEAVFDTWCAPGSLDELARLAAEEGIILQSVHAPFNKVDKLWKDDEAAAEEALGEQLACLEDTARLGVPIMVTHVYIGFGKGPDPDERGIARYRRLVDRAGELGVKIAFENTEGEEYLTALMDAFKDDDRVGFCWDTGHELCYNRGRDMMALYGDRLVATHINDNLGVSRFDGEIFWTDDLHLLPFDGIADWDGIAARLDACGFSDIMCFELTVGSKPGRHDNDLYKEMSPEKYLAEAYKRACRVAAKRKVKQ